MKYDKLIKDLRICACTIDDVSETCKTCSHNEAGDCYNKLKNDASNAIEELQAQLPKWISVEEKLPDFEGAVLCMRKSHIRVGLSYQEILYFDYDDQWFKDMFRDFFVEEGCITHWMPLPEPPKEDA